MKNTLKNTKRRFLKMLRQWRDKFTQTIHLTRQERKQSLHVIVFPQNTGQSSSFTVSYFLIAFIVIFLIANVWGSIYYTLTQAEKKALIETAQSELSQNQQELKTLAENANQINQFQNAHQQQINDIFRFLGNFQEKQIWETETHSTGEEYPPDAFTSFFDEDNYAVATSILHQLKQHKISLENGYSHLTNIENYLVFKQDFSRTVPNGWPLEKNNGYKTSSYGPRFSPFENKVEFHPGVDLAAAPSSKILSAADGIVEFSGEKSGYGKIVILRHQYGYKTLYAHNKDVLVAQNQVVKKGQPIAILGNTGRSTGHHLHFEVRVGNKPVDPWPYIVKNF